MKELPEEEERQGNFKELQSNLLAVEAKAEKAMADLKQAAKEAWATRQQARLDEEKKDKEAAKVKRLESIEKNRVDSQMYEPGYGPDRWCWPKAGEHPRHWATSQDVAVTQLLQPGGMMASHTKDYINDSLLIHSSVKLYPQHGERALLDVVGEGPKKARDIKERERKMREEMAAIDRANEQLEKEDRERAARALREEERRKKQDKEAAEKARIKQIKREMAAETKKQQQDAEAKAKVCTTARGCHTSFKLEDARASTVPMADSLR